MRKRKFIAITLTIAMILSSFSMAFATDTEATNAEVATTEATFPDTANHWAKSAIDKWAELGVLKGDDRGFRPNDPITRAEMATVLDNMMDYQIAANNNFSDVPKGAWYADAVLKANAAGILHGDGAGKADPTANITREQSAIMLARAFAVDENAGNNTKFKDAGSISAWAQNLVFGMESEGYIQGFEGKFNPKNSITRAEVVTIINNAVKAYYDTAGTYTDNVDGLAIIKVKDVTLKGNTINGNLIIAEGVGEGDVTLDSVTVKGYTVVRGGGENSVHITGNSSMDNIRIEKVNDKVRIVISDGVTVKYVEVAAGEEIIITGQVGTLELAADDVTVYANAAEINSANVAGQNSKIIVNKDSEIKEITAKAPVEISGEGTVNKVNLEEGADNSTITTPKTNINVADGVTGTTGTGGKVIPAGETATNGNSSSDAAVIGEAPATGGGGGGGSDVPSTVAVEGISVNKTILSLDLETTTNTAITATITPANATNKNVTWASSNADVATVDENGVVTAVGLGQATITVTTVDGAETAMVSVVVFGNNGVLNSTQRTEYDTIQSAIAAAALGDTILLNSGTFIEEGQIIIDKDITIKGINKELTIIKPEQNTVNNGDERGWFLVNDDVEFSLSDVTLDGDGYEIYQAIRSHGSGTVENNIFKNIRFGNYYGWGIAVMGSAMDIYNNDFSNIGRIGVQVYGIEARGSKVIGNTYTGKGEGDHIDNGIEVGAGAYAVIEGNTIINCLGTASSDGSSSTGILVTDYYGKGSEAVVKENTLKSNTTGLYVGYGDDDMSKVTATDNTFEGNKYQVKALSNTDVDLGEILITNIFPEGSIVITDRIMVPEDGKVYNLTIGNEYDTIQAAIEAADDNDTILVAAGTYNESVIVPEEMVKNITIIGVNSDKIPTLWGNDGTIIKGGITFGRDNSSYPTIEKSIVVKGITFSDGAGLSFKDIRNVTVENNKFIKINTGDGAIVVIDPSNHDRDGVTTIRNNYIDGVEGASLGLGIYVRRPAPQTIIEGNHVENTDHNSIQVVGVSEGPNVSIIGNSLNNWDQDKNAEGGRAIRINFDPIDVNTILTVTGNTFCPNDNDDPVDPDYVKITGVSSNNNNVNNLIHSLINNNTWPTGTNYATVILVNDTQGTDMAAGVISGTM